MKLRGREGHCIGMLSVLKRASITMENVNCGLLWVYHAQYTVGGFRAVALSVLT